MIGVASQYRKHDSTLAALSIARYLNNAGRRFLFNRFDWRSCCVDPFWDNKVVHYSFRKWLSKIQHAIWTRPMDEYFIDSAGKRKARTTLYTSWDQLEPYDEKAIGAYTHVLVPSLLQAIKLRDRFNIKNVAVMPYDTGLPITVKTSNVQPDQFRLFLSLYGTQLRRVTLSAIVMLGDIVRDIPNVHVTVACAKGLAPQTRRDLHILEKRYGTRWQVLHDCPWYEQAIQMGVHDLVVWPAQTDGFGLVGSTALNMGTPVIAWNIAPMNEFLAPGRNSILVDCEVDFNWLGVPHAKPNFIEFDRVLRWLICKQDAMIELRKHTSERLHERRSDYNKGWEAILPPDV